MEILYPKDYVKPEAEAVVAKDTAKLKTFIKGLVAEEPKRIEEIINVLDEKYVLENDEDYHFTNKEIKAVCEEIDAEFRPKVEQVVEPAEEPIK